ncbi:MAG: hypothetical protein EXQ56_04585 [Acidobacteria bacterium]|nr:hypothetical protein [Acidobacteriota bacterium]
MKRVIVSLMIGFLLLLVGVWFALTQPIFTGNRIPRAVTVVPDRLRIHVYTLAEGFVPRDYRHPENLDRATVRDFVFGIWDLLGNRV